jgi:2-polyprenyl-3-methyl-5-hydroxy-6-metoxy-1,4-benzoquinol methylase
MSEALVQVPCPFCGGDDPAPERQLNGFSLVRCRRCAFYYVNPRSSDEALNTLYTKRASEAFIPLYTKMASPSVIETFNQTLDLLEKLAPQKGRMLDVGCASGHFFEQALKRGWDAQGTDISNWAKEAALSRGIHNLYVGRLVDLHFPDHHFDVVHAAQVLEHMTNLREELAEMRRILRPGGLLYVDVPNYRTLPILMGRDDFLLNMPPQHIIYFTPRTLRTVMESAGFKDIQITSSSGLKWENLIGRRVKSDIADAVYGPVDPKSSAGASVSEPNHPHSGRGFASMVKKAMMATLIRPIFYNWFKVGINLIGTGRRD